MSVVLKQISNSISLDDSKLSTDALDVLNMTQEFYKVIGFHPPWCSYFAYVDDVCVGSCSFKGTPNAKQEVEIAYYCFPEFEGRGFATQMAKQLTAIALQTPGVVVTAQTLPEQNASTTILTKIGFTMRGTAHDKDVGEVWEWVYSR